jgi:hypothetical protein
VNCRTRPRPTSSSVSFLPRLSAAAAAPHFETSEHKSGFDHTHCSRKAAGLQRTFSAQVHAAATLSEAQCITHKTSHDATRELSCNAHDKSVGLSDKKPPDLILCSLHKCDVRSRGWDERHTPEQHSTHLRPYQVLSIATTNVRLLSEPPYRTSNVGYEQCGTARVLTEYKLATILN